MIDTVTTVWILLLASGARVVLSLFSLLFVIQWYKRNATHAVSGSEATPRILILLPVLREQSILHSTLLYFSQMSDFSNAQVLVITTERELSEQHSPPPANRPTTFEVAQSSAGVI